METLDADTNCILERADLKRFFPENEVESHENPSKGGSSNDLVKQLLASLTPNQLKSIFQYYELDFLAFGYEYGTYFDLPLSQGTVKFSTVVIE